MLRISGLVRGMELFVICGLLILARPAAADVKIDEFITLVKTVEGPKEKELKTQAELEAVRSCVGRLYFSERLILAEDLLDRYLKQAHEKFISESRLISREETKDNIRQTWRVVVNFVRLKADMEEKRFLYEPRYRPFFTVMFLMEESGRPTRNNEAREHIIRVLNENQLRVLPKEFQDVVFWQTDFTQLDADKQHQLRVMAQKTGIELLVTGRMNVIDKGTQSIYLVENFYYADIEAELHLVRVNDGAILYTLRDHLKYTDRTREETDKIAVKLMSERLALQAAERFSPAWQRTYLDQADYQVMVTGIDRDGLEIVKTLIDSLAGRKVEIPDEGERIEKSNSYVRGFYSDVAVLSVVYKGPVDNLIQKMTSAQYPRLVLRAHDKHQIALEQVR